MKNTTPIINVAVACEKILVEKDNVFSAVRIVDVFYIAPEMMAAQPAAAIPVSALILLKSGDYIGQGEISLIVEAPDGQRNSIPDKWPLLFDDHNTGGSLVLNLGIALRHIGITWVEVYWNGEFLTKFSIKLEVGVKPTGQGVSN